MPGTVLCSLRATGTTQLAIVLITAFVTAVVITDHHNSANRHGAHHQVRIRRPLGLTAPWPSPTAALLEIAGGGASASKIL